MNGHVRKDRLDYGGRGFGEMCKGCIKRGRHKKKCIGKKPRIR